MERKAAKNQTERNPFGCDALIMAEHFGSPVSVEDSHGERHFFTPFLWMGKWGICRMDKSAIIVRAKANYLYANVLDYAQLLIAGSADYGWDVYSIEGEFQEKLKSMPLNEAIRLLNARKRNNQ